VAIVKTLFFLIRIAFQHHINQPHKDQQCTAQAADAENQDTVIGG